MYRIPTWAAAAVLVLAAAAGARAAEADTIDLALHKQAPDVLQYLREQKYANVGVLKFLVRVGDGPLRDDVGGLNRSLADRLEVALVLGLTKADENQLGILLHAGDTVAKAGDPDLTHRTADGRMAFFPKSHPLRFQRAWGSADPVPADAFLTGEAVVAPDWRSVKLRVQVFDRKSAGDKEMKTIGDWFTAVADPRTLTDVGVSYARRKGVKDDDPNDTPQDQVGKLDSVVSPPAPTVPDAPPPDKVKEKERESAMDDLLSGAPVQLTIVYNTTPAPIQGGSVETPNAGDKVSFRLKNIDPDKKTYGVVLKINGENTIEHQAVDDLFCNKWVLSPGQEITLDGFQADDDTAKEFKVLPPEESVGEEVRYGQNAGLIQMVLFRAAEKPGEQAFALNDEKHNLDSKPISRGSLVCKAGRPFSLTALQDELKNAVNPDKSPGKGLVTEGAGIDSKVRRVDFTPYPRGTVHRSAVLQAAE